MPLPAETSTLFYARLHLALANIAKDLGVDIEEFARQLPDLEETFSLRWDDLPRSPTNENVRYLVGTFDSVPALYAIAATCINAETLISIRDIEVVPIPA